MKALYLALAGVAVLAMGAVDAKRTDWVLLIAGSSGYSNYRHQADVCHAYQIFHKAGIPDENIIVMMYDDVAYSEHNPYKGNLINRPGGPNVYPGVPKDYRDRDVNRKTFLAALQGDKEGVKKLLGREGKVIDSGPEDHIFVNYVDHGAPGILQMPYGPYLTAKDLNTALKSMHQKKRFAKLIFYVEACESGSMFENILPKDINVYATTAANATEPSWVCYFDFARYTYLGDVYSVKWMEDTDKAVFNKETFQQQYKIVKNETTKSHVMQYGNTSIAEMALSTFFDPAPKKHFPESYNPPQITDAIPSEMVRIQILKNRISTSPANSHQRQSLERELDQLHEEITQINKLFKEIAKTVYRSRSEEEVYDLVFRQHSSINNWDCYETALSTLSAFCPKLHIGQNEFVMRKVYSLVNLCNDQREGDVTSAIEAATGFSPLCLK